MNLTNLFYKLPTPFKNIATSIIAYKNNKVRKGEFFDKYLIFFRKSWAYTPSEIEKLQKQLLQNLLLECSQYTVYYKKVFDDCQITLADIENANPFELLNKIPFLEKTTLKEKLAELENTNPIRKRDYINFTSGTTGTPTKVYYDKESMQLSFALWRRFHDTLGLPEKFKSIRLSGRIFLKPNVDAPPYWIYNMVDQQLFMSSYHLSEDKIPDYVKKVSQFKPQLIDGYPSAIYILAKFINANNINLGFSPKGIATTAETLFPHQRIEIEKAFGCRVYNQYASSEGGSFITECKDGRYHLNTDSGIFEFINLQGETAKPGEYAELIITSFRNLKTPLIRYRSKDMVVLEDNDTPCTCGCSMPCIKDIIGREDDILYTKDRGFVGRMDTAYKGLSGIEKSQIVQNSADQIDIYQVVTKEYTPQMEKKFMDNLRERLGTVVDIKIHAVDDIPLSKNGKFKAVMRNFKMDNV